MSIGRRATLSLATAACRIYVVPSLHLAHMNCLIPIGLALSVTKLIRECLWGLSYPWDGKLHVGQVSHCVPEPWSNGQNLW